MANQAKIKELLIKQEQKVLDEIKALNDDDPVLSAESAAESSEPGTDSWMADVHTRSTAMKKSLEDVLARTRKALLNLKGGKYGICENCGKKIEEDRLKIMPEANYCISCSQKKVSS